MQIFTSLKRSISAFSDTKNIIIFLVESVNCQLPLHARGALDRATVVFTLLFLFTSN